MIQFMGMVKKFFRTFEISHAHEIFFKLEWKRYHAGLEKSRGRGLFRMFEKTSSLRP